MLPQQGPVEFLCSSLTRATWLANTRIAYRDPCKKVRRATLEFCNTPRLFSASQATFSATTGAHLEPADLCESPTYANVNNRESMTSLRGAR